MALKDYIPYVPSMDDTDAWKKAEAADRRERVLLAVTSGYLASYANPGAMGLPSVYKMVADITQIADALIIALDETHG